MPHQLNFSQSRNQIVPLYEDAIVVKSKFDPVFQQVAVDAAHGVQFYPSPLKHIFRAQEKTVMKNGTIGRSNNVYDIVRGMIECPSMEAMQFALEALVHRKDVDVVRAKCRFSNPSAGGWMDLMINVRLKNDPGQHVCEVQFVHKKLVAVRKGMGGHGTSMMINNTLC